MSDPLLQLDAATIRFGGLTAVNGKYAARCFRF